MLVVLLWVGRGKCLEATRARSFLLNIHLILPLAAFMLGSQAGVCCQVKPGVGFLEERVLPQRVERDGGPPAACPSITHFISVSVLASELKSCRGRSLTTQQHGSAFANLLFLRRKKNQTNPNL